MLAERLTTKIGKIPLISDALRWYANRFDEGSVVHIRQGLAANLLWRRSHRHVNGYWIGHYELPIQEALAELLQPGFRFFDVGANAGFFSLIGSRLVGASGHCVAFEPAPANVEIIREQLRLNGIRNCKVVGEAISDVDGEVDLYFDYSGSPMAHLGESRPGEGKIRVRSTTLDLASSRFGSPNVVKMDIEGAEVRALRGALQLLGTDRPDWLIEIHGPTCERVIRELFLQENYCLFDLKLSSLDPDHALPEHVIAKPNR